MHLHEYIVFGSALIVISLLSWIVFRIDPERGWGLMVVVPSIVVLAVLTLRHTKE